jgi:hypothetical protein
LSHESCWQRCTECHERLLACSKTTIVRSHEYFGPTGAAGERSRRGGAKRSFEFLIRTDRLFWAWLSRVWPGWQDALHFVQPRTVIAWQQRRFREHWRRLSQRGQCGRPTIAKDIRQLIRDMWQATPTWGAPRIVGELRKLGIDVAKSTVEEYKALSFVIS